MKSTPLGQVFSAFCLFLALFTAAAAAEPVVVSMGDNTYSITRQAGSAFSRDTDVLKASAKADAAKYCAAQGKEMKIISLTSERPWPTLGYASAKIVFKAFNAGDPELTRAPEAAPTITVSGTQVQAGSDDMYSELIKLDDLRKKGILTDDEFQAQKKKVLKRFK